MPVGASLRPPSIPKDLFVRVERISVGNISPAPQKAPTPPPEPPPTPAMRARKLVKTLETVGPGLEEPTVRALLKLGPEVLPVIGEGFPGLLWFNRRYPHRAVARGRDVSPVARTLVAFGEASVETVARLMRDRHPDIRFYATLVAQDLGAPGLFHSLAEATLDDDPGVREVAAAALIGIGPDATAHACGAVRSAVRDDLLMRVPLTYAIAALTRMRDPSAARVLVPLLGPDDPELNDLTIRALAVLTGQTFGRDVKAWTKWLDKNERRGRVEWLLESLERGHESVFDFVCDELAHLSGERLGEASASSSRDRKQLAKAYREHWRRRGA